jgi:membrane fusion protein (multidrug efflux system)
MNLAEKIKNGGRRKVAIGIAVIVILSLIWGLYYLFYALSHESTDDAFITGHIITVSARVPGHVEKVYVSDNQWADEGDVLVGLDPRDYQVSLDMAQAALASARATVEQDRARAEKSAVEVNRTEKDYNRYKQLFDANAGITQQQVDNAYAAAQSALAQLEADKGQVAVSQARVAQAQTSVDDARLKLSYTKIHAPQAGRITSKSVEPGEYITTGQPLLTIVPEKCWVIANFKETQLKYMKPGQQVKIKVDAFPQKTFKAHVDSIQAGTGSIFSLLPPENATGNYIKVVQRVPVKIVFDEDQNDITFLSPGMSVVPKVKVK